MSPYLDTIQTQVLSAKDELVSKEFALLQEAKEKISNISKSLTAFAETIAWLDVYSSHALLAKEKNFTKPEFTNNTQLSIVDGRHPVIEEFLPRDLQFIPNDLFLNAECRVQNLESQPTKNSDNSELLTIHSTLTEHENS